MMAQIGLCQLCPKNPAKGVKILLSSVSLRVPKGHVLNQYPPPKHTLPFQRGDPLSMVWKQKAE